MSSDTGSEPEHFGDEGNPMAICGSSPRARMKRGEKKVAPPIPAPLAIAAMTTAIGGKNQYSIPGRLYLVPRPTTFAAFTAASDAPGCVLVLDERPGAPSSCVLARDTTASPSTSPTLVARALVRRLVTVALT
jgi:hypothetical protein